jgi:hypothetical protein
VSGNQRLSCAINSSLYYLMSSSSPDLPLSLSPGGLASNGSISSFHIRAKSCNYITSQQVTTGTHFGTASRGCSRRSSPCSPPQRYNCCSTCLFCTILTVLSRFVRHIVQISLRPAGWCNVSSISTSAKRQFDLRHTVQVQSSVIQSQL